MEGNKMHIRYRTMMANRSQKPSLTKYDSSGVYATVLQVPPKEFARQITLLDLQVFQNIQPDELTSCAWSKKEKLIKAPNVVAFTRRFNDVNCWVQREIFNTQIDKTRVDVLAHFIKIGKKLLKLNNLHAAMAVVSALHAAYFQLSETWMKLRKKDKQSYEKMAELLSPNNNWNNLRDYMASVKQPCIPYLGLYLSDLTYIDIAHPHHGGMESQPRRLQMNNIIRVIADLQQSTYDIGVKEHVQNYLKSVVYLEELQTCEGFLERKTKLKDGRKPLFATWKRYWVQLSGTNLMYCPAKSRRKLERGSFKSKHSKMTSILGWTIIMGDNPLQPDAFQIRDPVNGNTYKFRAGTQAKALLWCQHLGVTDV